MGTNKDLDSETLVLVTGATGFLGGRLARMLIARGFRVRATGRNLKVGMALARIGADFRPVDLQDRPSMIAVCKGVSTVVHAGALSSPWGSYRDFFENNVVGTQHVIDGCMAHGVRRLVYVSSPSVMTRMVPQLGLTEADPLPEKFVSLYSKTKKLGEDRVRDAQQRGLSTVIIRPKAIYGPGDKSIFPRLIEAASKKRLPVIGDGQTVTDLTFVDDVAEAILLAMEKKEASGQAYLIVGSEAVRIWDVIGELVSRLGHPLPSRKFSLKKTLRIAKALEFAWRIFRLPGEPPLTEYKVAMLGISQTYNIQKARRELGYEPRVTLEQGIERTLDALQGKNIETSPVEIPGGDREPVGMRVSIFKSGSTHTIERLFKPGGRWKAIHVPAMCALLEHPVEGPILFDTGYSRRYFESTRRFPFKLAAITTPASVEADEEIVAQLRSRGIAPESVRWIILSHFDPDHYGGLRDFPNARIVCSRPAWQSIVGKTGWAAFRIRLFPGHLPEDMAARVYLLPDLGGPAIPPFERSLDLFSDGSIRLVEVPGHAAGQMAAFVRQVDGDEIFLAADACWNLAMLDREPFCGGVHRMIAVDKRGQDATYAAMRRLRRDRPHLVIVPTHCPLVWHNVSMGQPGENAG